MTYCYLATMSAKFTHYLLPEGPMGADGQPTMVPMVFPVHPTPECPVPIIASFINGKFTGDLVPYNMYANSLVRASPDDNAKAYAYLRANILALRAYANKITL